MDCLTDEILRAHFDAELNPAERARAEDHISVCPACRERASLMARRAHEVSEILSHLAPASGEGSPDAALALAQFKARQRAQEATSPAWAGRLFGKRLRPAWGVVALACVAVGFLGFAPARTWAQKFLAMLRVEKITVVPVDLTGLGNPNGPTAAGKMLAQMISDNIVVTAHGKPQTASSAEEATRLAGFNVRLLSDRSDAPQLTIAGEQAFHMIVNRDRVQAILDELGHSELTLPPALDGATIAVDIPPAVMARYGPCPGEDSMGVRQKRKELRQWPVDAAAPDGCVMLAQVPSPTVSVPPNLNLQELAEAGLQVAGMTPDQAHAFCQTVDWTSTLVIPLPNFISSYQKVLVDGVEGTLMNFPPPRGSGQLPRYGLIWVKNGKVYSLTSVGTTAEAVALADSLD